MQTISPAAHKDIQELKAKIQAFREGEIPEDKFKAYRLTRGVYGQRQLGVQMFRIKIPYGHMTADQLIRMADVSEKYTNGNLHLTTRQDIQYHYIKLGDTPDIWTELAEKGITAREACGNTVRNLTASPKAGIDPDEPFDITPYAHAVSHYFLRNPICQDMGRKIKPAFSSSEKDSAFTYFHDFGFIPRIQTIEGTEQRGFKVVVGGGLGSQAMVAQTAYEFLPEDQIIPFMEAGLRVFDRYGERAKRFKARMKFLLQKLGLEALMELIRAEQKALPYKSYSIDTSLVPDPNLPAETHWPSIHIEDTVAYQLWRETNVFEQKQSGFYGVALKVFLGDLPASRARDLAAIVKKYAADDLRITVNQGILLRYVRESALPHLYLALKEIQLADPGFDSVADITACPGTDTCNLAVTNSTGLSGELERMLMDEYASLIHDNYLKIKISGCMNACGQHMAAQIGLHGSSIKSRSNGLIVPAMQVVMGGGVDPEGKGYVAEKVVKIPTKKIPEALRLILDEFEEDALPDEYFNDFYYRKGKRYFYSLLKPLADLNQLTPSDFRDWDHEEEAFVPEVGVGECAGVMLDVVGSIIQDAQEKVSLALETLHTEAFSDSIYHSYSAFVIGAKALLLARDVKCNTHKGILNDFDQEYGVSGEVVIEPDFATHVLRINQHEPSREFAIQYLQDAQTFLQTVIRLREAQLQGEKEDKTVVESFYKA